MKKKILDTLRPMETDNSLLKDAYQQEGTAVMALAAYIQTNCYE